ncbi:MAG: HEAT repeat domain-containing protein [Saprospiraceae bacterium]|nr:HEAT repeat domain-containing protein [Saprospiraceae bacterium]
MKNNPSDLSEAVLREALRDKHWSIRLEAVNHADITQPEVLAAVVEMAKNEPEPSVRAVAISLLGQTEDIQYTPIFTQAIQPDQAYSVLGAALEALSKTEQAAALAAAKELEGDDNDGMVLAIAELYATQPSADNLSWFVQRAEKIDNMGAFRFYDLYTQFLTGMGNTAVLEQSVERFKAVSFDTKASLWRRFSNTKAIADLRTFYAGSANAAKVQELTALLAEIKEKETNETLKLYYGMFDQP